MAAGDVFRVRFYRSVNSGQATFEDFYIDNVNPLVGGKDGVVDELYAIRAIVRPGL